MKTLARSTALKIAAVLSFLANGFSVVAVLPMMAQGAAAADQGTNSPPFVVLSIALVAGIVGMVAAFGAWKQQRWGVVLTILANVANGLGAAPGILVAPTTPLFVAALSTVILTVLIVVLCLWRDRKPAIA